MPDGAARTLAALPAVDQVVEAWREREGVLGVTVAIVLGEHAYSGGFGSADVAGERPLEARDTFRVASMTKLVTAALVLRARERGLLSLDDPVARHLPLVAERLPGHGSRITFRHCLGHVAGLAKELPGVHFGLDAPVSHPDGAEPLLRQIGPDQVVGEPMTRTHYSNIGYQFAGLGVAAAFGEGYAALAEREVLRPLGMTRSGFDADALPPLPGWYADGAGGHRPAPPLDYAARMPNGGLLSDVEDMLALIRANAHPLREHAPAVLHADSIREAHVPVLADWGLGCLTGRLDGERVVGHGGHAAGFNGELLVLPELPLGVVVFANTNTRAVPQLSRELLLALLPQARRIARAGARGERAPLPAAARELEGRYETTTWCLDVFVREGRLEAISDAMEPGVVMRLTPLADGRLRVENGRFTGELLARADGGDGPARELTLQGWLLRRCA